ncbi:MULTISPECIES: hypothetical protein [unclassified Pseudodesulfovibrio]|uniref:hypothetical protein n=1 Tax=unclassified Pseudodesulfovibrio TaxID=2661612 RepID=UPI000FEC0FF5|nr:MULTISPECIES: hypothetical protein [unclassified Pseudodesulfovibrio]MCJ2165560.1 hypothetical protein [Pseudodesulfovibrio sp. S3-i]RWU03079.1 hypothetical protein DWB63_12805 [Pseudodesulfovibrio sp. S3]
MHMRTKSALVVIVGLALAFAVVFSFDYTDRYVSDRFNKAIQNAPAGTGESFSLDALMEYYDWDSVCVVLPGSDHGFTTLMGRDYEHQATDIGSWSLVFIKGEAVTAEITIDRTFLEYPDNLEAHCFDRWGAVFFLNRDDQGQLHLTFSGH